MALIADIEHNHTFAPAIDVYIRINYIQIDPLMDAIKIGVGGYPTIASRNRLRQILQDQREFADRVWQSPEGQQGYVGGSIFNRLVEERQEFQNPPWDGAHPVHIWYDTYSIKITDDIDLKNKEKLLEKLYGLIRTDYRFTNVRDDLDEEPTNV